MNKITEFEQEIKSLRKELEAYYRNDHQAIAKLDHKLNELESQLEEIEVEKETTKEDDPAFKRLEVKQNYYNIQTDGGKFRAYTEVETEHSLDTCRFRNNNYFHTYERAQEVTAKINFLLKLERLHDIYCPDYVPV